jgi:hypothetical protein
MMAAGTLPSGIPRWKPSLYQLAVALSMLSAVLGLGRDVLVVARLGLGAANDDLQFALSVIYTISLLGDPLRLAGLNLLERRTGIRLNAILALGIMTAAAFITLLFHAGATRIPLAWLLKAGIAGAANLFFAWVLPRCQRAGPFLPVHAVTVLPNILIVIGLVFPAATPEAFAGRVVVLFLLAPLVQLTALVVLSSFGERRELAQAPTVREGLRPIAWHATGAMGGQAGQFFLRRALLLSPPGTLSGFALVLRGADTLRAVFVDTYIAVRVRRSGSGALPTASALDGRWLNSVALTLVATLTAALALVWRGSLPTILSPAAVMVVIGTYLVLALRVRYQEMNTSALPLPIMLRMTALEIVSALAAGLMSVLAVPVALFAWLIYVAKPAAGLRILSAHGSIDIDLRPES